MMSKPTPLVAHLYFCLMESLWTHYIGHPYYYRLGIEPKMTLENEQYRMPVYHP